MNTFIKNKISASICICTMVLAALSSCTSDNEFDTFATADGDTQFRLNIGMAQSRAASDTMKTWVNGNVVYLMVDGKPTDVCKFTYKAANNDWDFAKIGKIDTAFAQTGTIKAVYAQSLSGTVLDSIVTRKDVLYGLNGTYTRDGKFININVNLDQRPMAKIRLNGIPAEFNKIDQLRETSILNFEKMEWRDMNYAYLANETDMKAWTTAGFDQESETSYTFYGLLDSCSTGGKTTIKLVSADKKSYFSRTFDQTLAPGDYAIINGPLTDDASKWSADLNMDSISVLNDTVFSVQSVVNFRSLDTLNVGATFSGGTAGILDITSNGMVTTHSKGVSSFVATAAKAPLKQNVKVKVVDVDEVLTIAWGDRAYSARSFGYTFSNSTALTPTPVDIQLTAVQVVYADGTEGRKTNVSNDGSPITIKAGSAYRGWLQIEDVAAIKGSKLRCYFTVRGKEYVSEYDSMI